VQIADKKQLALIVIRNNALIHPFRLADSMALILPNIHNIISFNNTVAVRQQKIKKEAAQTSEQPLCMYSL
jgi:hypothetical protein